MATTYKTLTANDISNTRTLLHEAIPMTGTISSGTYSDANIKTYSHGMFESVYDYPYLSSSANHIYDITYGYATASAAGGAFAGSQFSSSNSIQNSKKINIYNQMAQMLVGYNAHGEIQRFDQDGNIAEGGKKFNDAVFINFARLLSKDEIKKGSFSIAMLTGGTPSPLARTMQKTIGDYSATSSYFVNSPAGEYGILYTSSAEPNSNSGVGLVYYQAGIAVLTGGIFTSESAGGTAHADVGFGPGYVSASYVRLATGSTIETMADSFRNRIVDINFNNTVELNSTIHFCRASHNEFNYSSNPTYLSDSQIRVKSTTTDNPVSYITTVGLYSSDNELMAVAKLSEPLKKDPSTELTIRVRLDY